MSSISFVPLNFTIRWNWLCESMKKTMKLNEFEKIMNSQFGRDINARYNFLCVSSLKPNIIWIHNAVKYVNVTKKKKKIRWEECGSIDTHNHTISNGLSDPQILFALRYSLLILQYKIVKEIIQNEFGIGYPKHWTIHTRNINFVHVWSQYRFLHLMPIAIYLLIG